MKKTKKFWAVLAAAGILAASFCRMPEAMHQQVQEAAAVPQHHLPQTAAPHRIPVRKK